MKKPKEIFVLHHSSPEGPEAQAEAAKYREQGYDVYVFAALRPRNFQGWSLSKMVAEMFRLERFTRACQQLKFSGQATLHAKIELDHLRTVLQDLIPRNPFMDLPIKTVANLRGIQNYVTSKTTNNE